MYPARIIESNILRLIAPSLPFQGDQAVDAHAARAPAPPLLNITRKTCLLAAALELWTASHKFIPLTVQAPPYRFLDTYADNELIIIALDILHSPPITSKALRIFTVIHAQLNCLAELEAPVVLVN